MYLPEWKAQRTALATTTTPPIDRARSLTANELWQIVWPELFGELELDLALTGLVGDLDRALDTRPWHFVRDAILRLPDIEGTWVQKAVRDVIRRRSADLPNPGGGSPSS